MISMDWELRSIQPGAEGHFGVRLLDLACAVLGLSLAGSDCTVPATQQPLCGICGSSGPFHDLKL